MMAVISRQLGERIADKKRRLDSLRPLRADTLHYLHDELRVVLTYHSNAIEGNTLDLKETRLVLEEGLTVGGHTLREHTETTNHASAFDYLEQLVRGVWPLDANSILDLHRLVMAGLIPLPGALREVAVYISGVSWTPPHPSEVPGLLDRWIKWVAGESQDYHPIEWAGIAHAQFEAIHPFVDGNGRVGRLLMNMMLMQEGYPPAILLRQWRSEYIAALQLAQLAGKYRPIVNLVGRAVEQGLDLYLNAIDTAQAAFIPLPELAAEFGYDVNYLGKLARSGSIAATKRAGRWYTRRQDIVDYKARVETETRGHHRGK